jgi:hypothetical protein
MLQKGDGEKAKQRPYDDFESIGRVSCDSADGGDDVRGSARKLYEQN